jgi:hypothetical protein
MGARQSEAVTTALSLWDNGRGLSVREAADEAGIWYTTLYAAIRRHNTQQNVVVKSKKRKK